jgi:hypothetical protein
MALPMELAPKHPRSPGAGLLRSVASRRSMASSASPRSEHEERGENHNDQGDNPPNAESNDVS